MTVKDPPPADPDARAELYVSKARECLGLAAASQSPTVQSSLINLAASYEKLAGQVHEMNSQATHVPECGSSLAA